MKEVIIERLEAEKKKYEKMLEDSKRKQKLRSEISQIKDQLSFWDRYFK